MQLYRTIFAAKVRAVCMSVRVCWIEMCSLFLEPPVYYFKLDGKSFLHTHTHLRTRGGRISINRARTVRRNCITPSPLRTSSPLSGRGGLLSSWHGSVVLKESAGEIFCAALFQSIHPFAARFPPNRLSPVCVGRAAALVWSVS